MAQLYGKKTSDGFPKALECTDAGLLKVDTELTATIDPTGLATAAKQDTIIAAVQGATPAGTALIGKVGIDQATANANEVVVKSITAGSNVVGKVGIDQTTPGTTNLVNVNGGASQTADIKVTLDSEKVAVSGIDAGTNLIGKVGIDQVTANANEVVVKSITAGPLPDTSGSDLAGIHSSADTIAGAISSSRMQVDLKGTKGSVTTAHNAITDTATSSEIDCSGYNALLVETIVTVAAKNWTVKVTGCLSTGGTFGDCYDGATLMSYQTNASRIATWKGIPNFVKIVATEDEPDGTCTVRVQPLMV